jgi:hypothetical protein
MNITIRPLGRGHFAALLGDRLLCESKTPFFSAARILRAEGASDHAAITMSHEGSGVVSMRSTVGEAAGLTVLENDSDGLRFAPFEPPLDQTPISFPRGSAQKAIVSQGVGRPW